MESFKIIFSKENKNPLNFPENLEKAINKLIILKGVGPATASLILSLAN
jgi:endonuclease III